MEGERKSSIHKISGGTDIQKEATLAKFADTFSNPAHLKFEREKTPVEKEIIEGAISEMSDFLQGYGARPLPITVDHVHILDENKLSGDDLTIFKERYSSAKGFYRPASQDIWLFASKMKSPLMTAKIVAHELIHFLSYNATVIKQDGEDHDHRMGLAIQDPKVDLGRMHGLNLFNETNEATTEGLVKRFFPRLKHIPALKKEYQKLEEVQKANGDELAYVKATPSETEPGMFNAEAETFSYREFRDADHELFNEILKQHPDQFASEEEVFTVFARAAMTGDVKRMASLVESLGRGAFRALARRKTPERHDKAN